MVDIRHAKVSAIADDPAAVAAGEVVPSDWNDPHDSSDVDVALAGKAAAIHTHAGEDIDSGTVADARVAATLARDSETAAAVAAEAALARNADNLTSGTVADARIAATIARDTEVTAAIAAEAAARDAAIAAYAEPLDSDLQAIAALATTAYGRAFLVLANAAAGRTALGLGTAAVAATGDFDAAGAAAAAQAASQPLDSDLTAIAALSTTSYGRSLLAAADAAALRTLAGAEASANKGVAGGYASLDGGGTVPDAQLPAALARDSEVTAAVAAEASARDSAIAAAIAAIVNGAPGILDTLEEIADALGDDPSFAATMTTALAGKQALDAELTALAGLVSAADRLPYFTGIGAASLATFTSFARTLIDDVDAAAARTTLGLGTAALSATGDFDAAGAAAAAQAASQPLDSDLTAIAALSTTSFGRSLLALADAAALRTAGGLVIGTDVEAHDADLTAIAALVSAANKVPYATGAQAWALADLTAAGRALIDDADASAQRTTLGLGTLATQSGTFSGTSSGTNTGDQTLPTRASLGLATSDTPQFAGIEVGAASDTTLGRTSAGVANIEGKDITLVGGVDVAVADGGTGASTAAAAATNLGLGTGDSPQHAAVNVGHATDTTLDRASAGVLQVEGNRIFAVGGTDVPVADGGTGASTAAAAQTNLGVPPNARAISAGSGLSGGGDLSADRTISLAAGTSFPGSPATNDRFFRTDLSLEFFYDGTRWLTTELFELLPGVADAFVGGTGLVTLYAALPSDLAVYLVKGWVTYANFGTQNGSNYWSFQFGTKTEGSSGSTNRGSAISGSADAGSQYHGKSVALGIALTTTEIAVFCGATKTGTPGSMYFFANLQYRKIST